MLCSNKEKNRKTLKKQGVFGSFLSCVDRKDTTVKVLRRNVFAVLQPCVRKEWSPLNFFLFRISKPILFHEFHGKPFSFGCKHNRFFTAFTADKILFLQPLQNREIISLPAAYHQSCAVSCEVPVCCFPAMKSGTSVTVSVPESALTYALFHCPFPYPLHNIVVFCRLLCYPVCGATDKRQAVSPLHCQGRFLPPDLIERGAAQMSTSEVLQLCLVIIGICSLFVQVYKKK